MVEYDFFPVPGQDSEKESARLYPRFVSKETLDLNELIDRLDVKYDRATIVGVVTALEDALVHELGNSRSVRLGDIGIFSLHVSGPKVKSRDEIRAASVRVDGVNFKPTKHFVTRCNAAGIARAETGFQQSAAMDEGGAKRLLEGWFASHEDISTTEFSHISGLRPDRARAMLHQLVAASYLKQSGRLSATRYSKKA